MWRGDQATHLRKLTFANNLTCPVIGTTSAFRLRTGQKQAGSGPRIPTKMSGFAGAHEGITGGSVIAASFLAKREPYSYRR
jgi:hypothetical protein